MRRAPGEKLDEIQRTNAARGGTRGPQQGHYQATSWVRYHGRPRQEEAVEDRNNGTRRRAGRGTADNRGSRRRTRTATRTAPGNELGKVPRTTAAGGGERVKYGFVRGDLMFNRDPVLDPDQILCHGGVGRGKRGPGERGGGGQGGGRQRGTVDVHLVRVSLGSAAAAGCSSSMSSSLCTLCTGG